MKKSKTNLPATVAPIAPEVLPPLGDIEEPDYNTPGERINYHVGMAQHHGRQALAHLILAGWELSKQKQTIGYGGWVEWCENNLSISRHTADRYIMFFQKTVGEARNAAEIPLAKRPTAKELSAATVGLEQKSATRAMIDLDIIKRPAGWGGKRAGAGHPNKNADVAEAAELDAIANNPALLYAAIKGPLDAIWKLHSERDVFRRLGDDECREVAGVIFELNGICSKVLRSRGIKG